MPTPKRVTSWLTLSIAWGNTIQIGGLLGAVVLAWYAGREGVRGTRWIVVSRLLAYFSEHAFCHWLVGRSLGIRFTGYGLHGTSHPQHYPPGVRWVFSHLPLNAWCELSARNLRGRCPFARVGLLTDPQGKGTDSSWSIWTPSSLHFTLWWTTSATLIRQHLRSQARKPRCAQAR